MGGVLGGADYSAVSEQVLLGSIPSRCKITDTTVPGGQSGGEP